MEIVELMNAIMHGWIGVISDDKRIKIYFISV